MQAMGGLSLAVYKISIMKSVFIAVLLMAKINVMAQTISLTGNGLSVLELNSNIAEIKGIQYDRIENYPNIDNGLHYGVFRDHFTYYYVMPDCVVEGLNGVKKDIFFASDTTGKIRAIFIALQNADDSVKTLLTSAFGPVRLTATSGIGAHDNGNLKTYWNNGKVSVFLSQNIYSNISELEIANPSSDEKSPSFNIRLLYKKQK
jgi:hypothetical protein